MRKKFLWSQQSLSLMQGRRKLHGFGQANGAGAMFARGVWGHAPQENVAL